MQILVHLLQTTVALGILNVWLLRSDLPTPYRGGSSRSLKEEFAVYGLPSWFLYVVGALKLLAAALLLAGLWIPSLALGAAVVMAILMAGAVSMHVKVKDPFVRSLPALVVLAFAIIIAVFYGARTG